MSRFLAAVQQPRWRPFVYLPAATVLTFLTVLGLGLLGALAAVFFVFALPYWLGERRPRSLAVALLAVVLLTGLLLAGFVAWDAYRPGALLQLSGDGVLSQGTVDPTHGEAATLFTFRVVYTFPEPPAAPPLVNVTSTFLGGSAVASLDLGLADPGPPRFEEGAPYEVTVQLDPGTHRFHFAVQLPDGRWVETVDVSGASFVPRGPVNLPPAAFLGLLAVGFLAFVLLAVGVPGLVVVAVYGWVRGRSRRTESGPEGKE